MSDLKIQSYTFWQLAKAFHIEIPIVQRDYAQGRKDSKSEEVRNLFLEDLLQALKDDAQPMELDFVYGKVEIRANNPIFIPIDGQQRLTTLFLLHWYVAVRAGKHEDFSKISFSYKTRISAQHFCEQLTKNKIDCDDNPNLAVTITDAAWFFKIWERDPTVQAILIMLDALHKKFKEQDCCKIWDKLIANIHIPICFKFLNLQAFELTDELYLKMNARGIPLSNFENFKTWLIGHIKSKQNEDFINTWCNESLEPLQEHWTTKMDGIWTDWIWRNEDSSFDSTSIHFIKNIAFISFFKYDKLKPEDKNRVYSDFLSKATILFLSKNYEICFPDIESCYFLLKAFQILSVKMTKNASFFPSEWTTENKDFIKKTFTRSDFEHRSYLFAIIQFYYENIERENFEDWFRVARNLIKNTTINADNFENILASIQLLAKAKPLLSNLDEAIGFKEEPLAKEKLKLRLFEQNERWKVPIIDAENHSFFKGNIHFLLPDGEEPNWERFIQRKDIAKKLFNENGDNIDKTNYLLMRSTLSKYDAGQISFPITLKDSKENWKKLLDKEFKDAIIRLLDDLVVSAEYKHSLEKICADFNTTIYLWQENLVKNSFLLSKGHSEHKKVDVYLWDKKRIFLYYKSNWTNDTQILIGDRERNLVILTFIRHGFKFEQEWQMFDESHKFFKGGNKIMLRKDDILLHFHFDKIEVNGNNKEYKFGEIEKLKNDFPNYFPTI